MNIFKLPANQMTRYTPPCIATTLEQVIKLLRISGLCVLLLTEKELVLKGKLLFNALQHLPRFAQECILFVVVYFFSQSQLTSRFYNGYSTPIAIHHREFNAISK